MSRLRYLLIASLLLFVSSITSLHAQPSAEQGKALFQQCTACHALQRKGIGPALMGVNAKYAGDEEWLYSWIRNAPALVAAGDPKAVALRSQYPSLMQAFPTLTDDQIGSILLYIGAETERINTADPEPEGPVNKGDSAIDPSLYYTLLALVGALLLIALVLVVITATLVSAVRAKEQKEDLTFGDIMSRTKAMLQNQFVITAITIFVLVGGTAKWIVEARTISLHQGYMPEQPIAFSHKLHAGEYEIDCQYCHTGASKSKNSWIPSANVCMNCHKAIYNRADKANRHPDAKGENDVSPEIAKIYEAVGWDPENYAYIEDYKQKPIEWIRIHNLPDHAYFNHAQHVTVGGQECQTCHGEVQEMEVVYQYSDLGMGWCISCHRNEKVKIKGEPTEDTVEDMGGLNCARCHY
ncbi:MAG: cytochrome c3 family protein [Bacteroidota bacterium]